MKQNKVQLILNENIQQKNGVMLHSIMLYEGKKKRNQTEIVIVICAMKLLEGKRQRLC